MAFSTRCAGYIYEIGGGQNFHFGALPPCPRWLRACDNAIQRQLPIFNSAIFIYFCYLSDCSERYDDNIDSCTFYYQYSCTMSHMLLFYVVYLAAFCQLYIKRILDTLQAVDRIVSRRSFRVLIVTLNVVRPAAVASRCRDVGLRSRGFVTRTSQKRRITLEQ